ncbi:NAD(P)H-dependent FMN reductase [Alteromonadaceae bacterium Bs31]|nr:NAD(P)H-dependent FMN reductase [Alteromonadaceae bacterium Bs31]
MKVVAFGASSSSESINKKLATYASSLLQNVEVEILDLNDFELPLFSVDKEKELGQAEAAQAFLTKIESADLLIISFAEHNGTYTAAYKNLYDWVSRIKQKVFEDKKVLLLASSPGPGGAKNVLASAARSLPHFGAEIIGQLSIPKFFDNFDTEKNLLSNKELKDQLLQLISHVE